MAIMDQNFPDTILILPTVLVAWGPEDKVTSKRQKSERMRFLA